MKIARLTKIAAFLLFLSGCTYESVRMHQRQRCGAMPQSEGSRCYTRTQDTRAEYEAKRAQLKQSLEAGREKTADPRYEQWIPLVGARQPSDKSLERSSDR